MTNLDVRHKCDNRHCINLDHLEHGTRKENINDIYIRDRHRFKLGNEDIINIASDTNASNIDLAKKYDIKDVKTVRKIKSGKTWSSITGINYTPKQKIITDDIGLKYILKDKNSEIWRVLIKIKNKNYSVGRYKTIEMSIKVRNTYLQMMNENMQPSELKELCKYVKEMIKLNPKQCD